MKLVKKIHNSTIWEQNTTKWYLKKAVKEKKSGKRKIRKRIADRAMSKGRSAIPIHNRNSSRAPFEYWSDLHFISKISVFVPENCPLSAEGPNTSTPFLTNVIVFVGES